MTTPSPIDSKEQPPSSKVKILLVDDRPENLFTLEAILESLGQDLISVRSGRDALRQVLESDFALILLDVKMPDMDGFETAKLIRSRERSSHIPILFLSAHRDDEHILKGYGAGAVDFLYKPLNPEVLRSKVMVFVDLSRRAGQWRHQAEQLEERNAALERTLSRQDEPAPVPRMPVAPATADLLAAELKEALLEAGRRSRDLERRYRETLDEEGQALLQGLRQQLDRGEQLWGRLQTTPGAIPAGKVTA